MDLSYVGVIKFLYTNSDNKQNPDLFAGAELLFFLLAPTGYRPKFPKSLLLKPLLFCFRPQLSWSQKVD